MTSFICTCNSKLLAKNAVTVTLPRAQAQKRPPPSEALHSNEALPKCHSPQDTVQPETCWFRA